MKIYLFALILLAAACGKDDAPTPQPNPDMGTDAANDQAPDDAGDDLDAAQDMPEVRSDCDEIDPGHCALPWPSNYFLKPDTSRETGYTLEFTPTALPANRDGIHIDPAPYRRRDGYGLGSPAVALFPNVDASGLPDEYSIENSLDENSQILFLEVGDTPRRVPFFVDHDNQTDDPEIRTLIVRPAEVLRPATRYVIAFRNLKDTDGADIPRSPAFEALATQSATGFLAERQARFDEIFGILNAKGWTTESLNLAWDWTTASNESLNGYMIHMRDEALEAFPEGPELRVTSIQEFTPEENDITAFRLEGEFDAPHYIEVLEGDARLRIGEDGMPEAEGTRTVKFWVSVPRTALTQEPHGLAMYGHGLFGEGSQTYGGFNQRIADKHKFIFFGASLWGMSGAQGGVDAALISVNLSKFGLIGDQLHQGMLEWILLARAFKHKFGALEEIDSRDIVLNDELYYTGISQGGIFGPTFVALSPDVSLGHAGVPGHTYSTLLHRSVDFAPFFAVLRGSYRNAIDQVLALNTIQLWWDGTDPVSYMWRLSADPIDEQVNHMLWAPTKGDFQVSVLQNELLTRTPGLGVALMENYDPEREVALVDETAYPHTGSAVVLYDFGIEVNGTEWRNPWPIPGNQIPTGGSDLECPAGCPAGESAGGTPFDCCYGQCCFDAHGMPRNAEWHNDQMVHFFRNNAEVIDVCNGDGCTPD